MDSLINATLNSKGWENLSEFYRNSFIELGNKYREAEAELSAYDGKIMRLDSAWKAYATSVDSSRTAQTRRAEIAEYAYKKEKERGKKPIGVDLHPIGFNPFTKTMYAGIGLSIRLFGFNPFKAGKKVDNTESYNEVRKQNAINNLLPHF